MSNKIQGRTRNKLRYTEEIFLGKKKFAERSLRQFFMTKRKKIRRLYIRDKRRFINRGFTLDNPISVHNKPTINHLLSFSIQSPIDYWLVFYNYPLFVYIIRHTTKTLSSFYPRVKTPQVASLAIFHENCEKHRLIDEGKKFDEISYAFFSYRYYARFIVVCLLLNKMKLVRELVQELDAQVVDYTSTYEPDDQMEWTLVLDEIKAFVKAESAVAVLHAESNAPVVLTNRLGPLSAPPVDGSSPMCLSLQEILIVGNCADQVCIY